MRNIEKCARHGIELEGERICYKCLNEYFDYQLALKEIVEFRRIVHPVLHEVLKLCLTWQAVRTYMEVGVSECDSLATVIRGASPVLEEITLCDNWGAEYGGIGRGSHEHVQDVLDNFKYKGKVNWLDGDSHVLLRKLNEPEKYDMILIDGDHSEAGVKQDIQECWPLLKVGGIMVCDDTGHADYKWIGPAFRAWVKSQGAEMLTERYDQESGTAACRKYR